MTPKLSNSANLPGAEEKATGAEPPKKTAKTWTDHPVSAPTAGENNSRHPDEPPTAAPVEEPATGRGTGKVAKTLIDQPASSLEVTYGDEKIPLPDFKQSGIPQDLSTVPPAGSGETSTSPGLEPPELTPIVTPEPDTATGATTTFLDFELPELPPIVSPEAPAGIGDQTNMPDPEMPDAPQATSRTPDLQLKGMPEMPPPPPKAPKKKTPVLKTMLDHSVLWNTVARAASDMEVKVAEKIKEKANEPPPPLKPFHPINEFKKATPCGAVWKDSDTGDRCRFCERCQSHVYDFTGLELPEAEELILKREAITKPSLFRRADGKFLTRDCPVAVKAKRDKILAIGGAIAAGAAIIAFFLMMPPPPHKPPATADREPSVQSPGTGTEYSGSYPVQPTATGTGSQQPVNSGSSPNTQTSSGRYCQPAQTSTAPDTTAVPVTAPGAVDADQYWQYSGGDGQPGGGAQPQYGSGSGSSGTPAGSNAQPQPESQPVPGTQTQQPTGSSQQPQAPVVQYYGSK